MRGWTGGDFDKVDKLKDAGKKRTKGDWQRSRHNWMWMMGSRWVTQRGPREEGWEDADGSRFFGGFFFF